MDYKKAVGFDAQGFELYEIETIRDRKIENGKAFYYIKWAGWPEETNTWEPIENLRDVLYMVDEFDRKLYSEKGAKNVTVKKTRLKKLLETQPEKTGETESVKPDLKSAQIKASAMNHEKVCEKEAFLEEKSNKDSRISENKAQIEEGKKEKSDNEQNKISTKTSAFSNSTKALSKDAKKEGSEKNDTKESKKDKKEQPKSIVEEVKETNDKLLFKAKERITKEKPSKISKKNGLVATLHTKPKAYNNESSNKQELASDNQKEVKKDLNPDQSFLKESAKAFIKENSSKSKDLKDIKSPPPLEKPPSLVENPNSSNKLVELQNSSTTETKPIGDADLLTMKEKPKKHKLKRNRADFEDEMEILESKMEFPPSDELNDFKIGKKKKTTENQSSTLALKPVNEDLFDIFDSIDNYALRKNKGVDEEESLPEEEETENEKKNSEPEEKKPKTNEKQTINTPSIRNESLNGQKLKDPQELLRTKDPTPSLDSEPKIPKKAQQSTINDGPQKPAFNKLEKLSNERSSDHEKKPSQRKAEEKPVYMRDDTLDELFKVKHKNSVDENPEKENLLKNLIKSADKREKESIDLQEKPSFDLKEKPSFDKKYQIDETGFFGPNNEINRLVLPFARLNYGNFQSHKPKGIKKIVYKDQNPPSFSESVYLLVEWENDEKNQKVQDSFHPLAVVIGQIPTMFCEYIVSHQVFEKKILENRLGRKVFSVKV